MTKETARSQQDETAGARQNSGIYVGDVFNPPEPTKDASLKPIGIYDDRVFYPRQGALFSSENGDVDLQKSSRCSKRCFVITALVIVVLLLLIVAAVGIIITLINTLTRDETACASTTTATTGPPSLPPGVSVPLYRAYSNHYSDHVYTTSWDWIQQLVGEYHYVLEGVGGQVVPASMVIVQCPTLKPLYQMWNEPIGDHFYTVHIDEVNLKVNKQGYDLEGIAAMCAPALNDCGATKRLHRFWSQSVGDHAYYAEDGDFPIKIPDNYIYEGIECYIW